MKPSISLSLCLLLALTVFSVAINSSCKRADNCKGVVCQHKGTCTAGFCVCPSGVGGDTCQTIFRNLYDNKYAGSANVNTAHIGYTLIFSVPATTANFLGMSLSVVKSASGTSDIPALPIALGSTSTSTSAQFNVIATTAGGYTYTGTGILYANAASLTLYKTPGDTTYTCTNFTLVP